MIDNINLSIDIMNHAGGILRYTWAVYNALISSHSNCPGIDFRCFLLYCTTVSFVWYLLRASPVKSPFVAANASSINSCLWLSWSAVFCLAGAAFGAAAAELDDAAAAELDDAAAAELDDAAAAFGAGGAAAAELDDAAAELDDAAAAGCRGGECIR